MINVAYGVFSLTSDPYNVTDYDGYGMPNREIKSIELARQDGAIQVTQRLGSKSITVAGQIKTASKAELITAIDQLKSYLYVPKRQLTVTDEDDVTRVWTCTPRNIAVSRNRGDATRATYSVEFYSPQPYSESAEADLLSAYSVTSQPINIPITIGGSYPASPIITITINSITAGEQTLLIRNEAEDRGIGLTRTWTAGDEIVIDCSLKDVYINTIKTDYTGSFPQWQVGLGSLSYSDTASARNLSITMKYKVRNL